MKNLYPIVNHNFSSQFDEERSDFEIEKIRFQAKRLNRLEQYDDMLEIACQLSFTDNQKINFLNKVLAN